MPVLEAGDRNDGDQRGSARVGDRDVVHLRSASEAGDIEATTAGGDGRRSDRAAARRRSRRECGGVRRLPASDRKVECLSDARNRGAAAGCRTNQERRGRRDQHVRPGPNPYALIFNSLSNISSLRRQQ